MKRKVIAAGVAMASLGAFGALAYAASHSVSDSPAPQAVIPVSPRQVDARGAENEGRTLTTDNPGPGLRGSGRPSEPGVASGPAGRDVPAATAGGLGVVEPSGDRGSNSGPPTTATPNTAPTSSPTPTSPTSTPTSTTIDDHGGRHGGGSGTDG